ncbi:sulfotransferase [soil metagenome]
MVTMTILDKVRNRTARVRQHRWRMRPYRSTERHIVIGGSPRSGTTLLRRILDQHPGLCCGPEMNLFIPFRFELEPLAVLSGIPRQELAAMFRASPSQGALIDAVGTRYRRLRGKPRWVEKTPRNVRHFGWVLERFPEARLIHVIRDGRDVACSSAEHPDRRWVAGRWVWQLHPRPVADHARAWVTDTSAGMRFRGDARYQEVRYEDLVARPEETLRELCAFIGEPFDAALLQRPGDRAEGGARSADAGGISPGGAPAPGSPDRGPVFTSSIGRWRRDLAGLELQEVLRICGSRLRELGYSD